MFCSRWDAKKVKISLIVNPRDCEAAHSFWFSIQKCKEEEEEEEEEEKEEEDAK
jgi:hypothetical protein